MSPDLEQDTEGKMKVKRLIELLEGFDPEAEVHLGEQPSWPFEYSISGVCERRDFDEASEEREDGNDVFLLEGTQLGYASKAMWDCERR